MQTVYQKSPYYICETSNSRREGRLSSSRAGFRHLQGVHCTEASTKLGNLGACTNQKKSLFINYSLGHNTQGTSATGLMKRRSINSRDLDVPIISSVPFTVCTQAMHAIKLELIL